VNRSRQGGATMRSMISVLVLAGLLAGCRQAPTKQPQSTILNPPSAIPPTEPPLPTRVPGPPGAPVLFTFPGSPAESAGVRAGDIITEIDGAAVGDPERLGALLDQHKPGDRITLVVWRPEGTIRAELELGAMADQPARAFSGLRLLYDRSWDPYAARREVAAVAQLGQTDAAGGEAGRFLHPRALAVAADGTVYVADTGNSRVQVFDADGKFVRQFGSPCNLEKAEGCKGDGRGQFSEPWGIAVAPDGAVYVSDLWNHRVEKFDAEGNFLGMWGKWGNTGGALAEVGVFFGPRGVALGQDGNVYVADTGNKRVQAFTPDGQPLGQHGGAGSGQGRLNEPVGLAQDADGRWYVTDQWNYRVQVFDKDWNYLAQWPVLGWPGDDITQKPGLAVDPGRKLVYITDPGNHRVLVYRTDGTFVTTWGTRGTGPAQFLSPTGIAVGPDGRAYVADGDAQRVTIFPPAE
jgi:DNA-binding beta-propeller fold protein YncE